jgi:prepilin-type N-terminal cleavage/methylation domain-containing protein
MTINDESPGFTIVEVLVTLFVAALFLVTGYQLYNVIIRNGDESRALTYANNVTYNYLQQYKGSATDPCTEQTLLNNQSINVTGLSVVTVSATISCPYGTSSSISKVLITLKYNAPQQVVNNATFVSP